MKFQQVYRAKLPAFFRNEMRQLVKAYYEPTITDEGAERLDPRAFAAYMGLTIGMAFSEEAFQNSIVFGQFTDRMHSHFKALRKNLPESAYDLSDIISRTGRQFTERVSDCTHLYEHIESDSMESFDEEQRGRILTDSFGYIGAAATVQLVELEIKANQPVSRAAWCDMRDDIALLDELDRDITVADFQ